jgi:hypothetical protein
LGKGLKLGMGLGKTENGEGARGEDRAVAGSRYGVGWDRIGGG